MIVTHKVFSFVYNNYIMDKGKNKAFVLSIVVLSLAVILFVITVLGRPAGGSLNGAILCLYMFMFTLPVFILSHVALINGIKHAIRKIPRAQETIIMSSIAIVITILTFICLGFLLGTGRLPHEIYFY